MRDSPQRATSAVDMTADVALNERVMGFETVNNPS